MYLGQNNDLEIQPEWKEYKWEEVSWSELNDKSGAFKYFDFDKGIEVDTTSLFNASSKGIGFMLNHFKKSGLGKSKYRNDTLGGAFVSRRTN